MLRINKILFPTDFSECAEHAFSDAANLAARFDADLHIFHTKISKKEENPALAHLLAEFDDDATDVPDSLNAQLTRPDSVDHQVTVIEVNATGRSACDTIVKYAEENEIDLIVMGTHGKRGAKRLFMGSTARCVVRHASCPVLTVQMDADEMKDGDPSHIIVPVDFSNHAKEAVKHANEFAMLWGARITLINVIDDTILPAVYGIEPVAPLPMKPLVDRSNTELKDIREALIDESIDVDIQVLMGRPSFLINDYAKEHNADLILMPTHGLTGLKRFLLGSVAESVIRDAPCAVLTIKPFGKNVFKIAEMADEILDV